MRKSVDIDTTLDQRLRAVKGFPTEYINNYVAFDVRRLLHFLFKSIEEC